MRIPYSALASGERDGILAMMFICDRLDPSGGPCDFASKGKGHLQRHIERQLNANMGYPEMAFFIKPLTTALSSKSRTLAQDSLLNLCPILC